LRGTGSEVVTNSLIEDELEQLRKYNCMQQLCVFACGFVCESPYNTWKYIERIAKDESLMCLQKYWWVFGGN